MVSYEGGLQDKLRAQCARKSSKMLAHRWRRAGKGAVFISKEMGGLPHIMELSSLRQAESGSRSSFCPSVAYA